MKKHIGLILILTLLAALAACNMSTAPALPGPGNGPADSGCPTPIGGGPTPVNCDGSEPVSGCPTPIGGGPTPVNCDGSEPVSGCPTPIGGGPTPVNCDGSEPVSGCPTPIGGGPTPVNCDGSEPVSGCPTPIGGGPTPVSCDDTGQPLTFIPNINAYCRFGPDPVFNSIGLAMKDESYPIDGRNSRGTWYRIMLSTSSGCWVPVEAGTTFGDISFARVLFDIPTPTPTFTPAPYCSSYTDERSCIAQTACKWEKSTTHAGGTCVTK